jgi:hypothetical protein
VESVVGEESPEVAVSVGDSDSDSVAATSEGRLEEFNFIGKQIVGVFPPWLNCFGGSQLFHGLRKLVLEVRGEWCRWCGGDNGIRWGKWWENWCNRPALLLIVFPIFNPMSTTLLGMMMR